MKYKVFLVGLGQVAMGYDFNDFSADIISTHAKAFSTHPDFELVGGIDPDADCCGRFTARYGVWAGNDLASGLISTQPDVVVVAVPTQLHAAVVHSALEHACPKLILCEKPLAYELSEAEAMVAACRERACLLYVNYLRRVEPAVLEIKRRLMKGEIATPLKGVTWYSKGLLHNGSHFSNLLEFWLGPIQDFKIINSGRMWQGEDPEPDVQVKFMLGEVTFLAAKEEYFSHHEIQLVAPNGCLRYEQGGAKILWQAAAADPAFAGYTVLALNGVPIATEGHKLLWHVANNVSACLQGSPSSLCSGDDALQTLKSLLRIKAAL